ncbi:MAG: cobalamin biosynthesis protein [Devosia sp.]
MTVNLRAQSAPIDRFVAGIGFSSAASADEIITLIESCLVQAGVPADQLAAIATHARKRSSPVLLLVAQHFEVPLHLLADAEIDGSAPGVCEAVAATAGSLHLGKRKSALATCALALCRPGFTLSDFGQPVRPSAAMAPSTLLASTACP